MEILIGLAVIVALLYVWLAGHWFGRVLMFVLLGIITFCSVATLADPVAGLFSVIPTWFVASIPIYCQRSKERQASRAKLFVYPLHWTLREIDEYEHDHPTFAAAIRRAIDFPALPSP